MNLIDAIKKLQFKRDGVLLAFAVVLVVFTGVLIQQQVITVKEGLGFLLGALALPGLFGKSKDDEPPPPPSPPNEKVVARYDAPKSTNIAARLAIAALLSLAACKATCPIIKLADQACPVVVDFVDQVGAHHVTTITNEDVREVAARRASAHDAGAP